MAAKKQRWIVIPNWEGKDGFQHYKDRDPIFIKNYRRLLTKDEYLTMSFHLRGILHSLWLEYAASNRQISDNTLTLTRRLGQRVTTRDLVSLNHAGFIQFRASKPLAPCYQRASPETETDKPEKDLKPPDQKPYLTTPAGLGDSSNTETLEEMAARIIALPSPSRGEGRLFEVLTDMDEGSPAVIRGYLNVLPPHVVEEVRAEVLSKCPRSPVKYAVGMLQKRANGRTAA